MILQIYISEAVNRFFTPQTADPVSSDPNPPNEPGADGKPPDCSLTQDNAIDPSEEEDEQRPHATVSLLSLSSATVAWKVCTNDSKSEEEEAGQLRKDNENKKSEDGRSREEDFDHVGNDRPGLLDAEPTGNQVEQEQREIQNFYTHEQSELPNNDQKSADAGSVSLTDGTVSKRMEESDEEPGAEEESKTKDDHQIGNEAMTEIQVPEDVEEDLEDEEQVCTITDEEDSKPEEGVDTDDVAPTSKTKNTDICEGVLQLSSENKNTSEEQKQVENQPSVCEVSQNKLIVSEQESGGECDERMPAAEEEDIREAAQRKAEDKEPETEQNNRTIQDGQQEEHFLTERLTPSEELLVQKTQQETAELTSKEEDVVVTVTQTTVTDVTTVETSLIRSFLYKDQVGKEWPTGEVDNKESCVENVCTSVTVKAETAQEVGREYKNILQPITEGQAAALHKLNPEVSGETREGVPEHNNELESDENKTRRSLEGGNCGEIHIVLLPKEVEDEEQASLKNSGMGAGYLLEREILEVTEENTDRSNSEFDWTVEELTESQHLARGTEEPQTGKENLESEYLFEEEEEVELLENSMKVKIKLLDKELETYVETDKTTEELQDGVKSPADAKEAAVDSGERREGVAENMGAAFAEEMPYFFEDGVTTTTETSLSLESVQSTHTNQNSEGTSSLPEEKSTSAVLQQIEIKLSGDSSVEILHVGLDTEEKDSTDEEETADKTQGINEITPLQLAETTDEPIKLQKDTENTLIAEPELSLRPERQEKMSQSPLRAFQMQEVNTITHTEAADESNATEATDYLETSAGKAKQEGRYAEETSRLIAGHQDVIDEEILDLWIEAAMSKDIDLVEEEDGLEVQNDTTGHPLKEESGDISEGEKELLMEPHSVEPTSVSDTEVSSSTLKPEILDQTQPRPTESFEDVQNMVATTSQSAGFSDLSALDSESQAVLMEETAETVEFSLREEDPCRVTESCSASGVSSSEEKHLSGKSEQSEEPDKKPSETEADMEGTAVWRNTEEADVTVNVLFQAEARADGEPVDNVLFEKEFVVTEHPSGDEHWMEAEKYQISLDHRSTEDFTGSLLERSRAEVAEEQEIGFEDQDEVLFPVRSKTQLSVFFYKLQISWRF